MAEGIRLRDPRAFELLYDRFARQAFGLAYRIVGDGPSAEDVVQEAFLTVWRQANRLNPTRGKLASFLMTVVHHRAVDHLRARNGRTPRNLPLEEAAFGQAETNPLETVVDLLNRDAVRQALQSLPVEQREAIELAYYQGLTQVEVAELLSVPLGTVKSRLRLGLEKMRSALGANADP